MEKKNTNKLSISFGLQQPKIAHQELVDDLKAAGSNHQEDQK